MSKPQQPDVTIEASDFIQEADRNVDPTLDEGRVPVLEANQKISNHFLPLKFGGDGSDGVLDTTSATVNIDLGAVNVVEKNYSKINIDTNDLTFSNPHSLGTIIFLRSAGDVTIASGAKINAKGLGASAANIGFALFDEEIPKGLNATTFNGAAAAGAVTDKDKKYLIYDPALDEWKLLRRGFRLACGSGGGNGSAGDSSGGSARGGGSGSGASYFTGPGTAGVNGVLGTTVGLNSANANNVGAGAGGGSGAASDGGSGENNGAGGLGGRGGTAIVIECAGELIFTGELDISGEDGVDGADFAAGAGAVGGGGGGGGGSAGVGIILANKITTNTGTIRNRGGKGGDGGSADSTAGFRAGGIGGTASATSYGGFVVKNNYF